MIGIIKKVEFKVLETVCNAKEAFCGSLNKARGAVTNRDGQGALDVAVTVLISIVLGALILAGLYLVLNGTVLPTITQKIKDMFNFKG
ncbi:DUF6133 family protein [Pseudobacteroides cellulosolvens]|uniref:Uncharacterized protein n=1 Tax=Pseudobacteroides cellulosolvens ATCC 35603 = DSM 2933 TaxID=398512 RepID=A0A0L6JUM0_9FIRM|nr:DUF6133 family protein [Pseudobacteroides cellulosolvens]KNY29518.1 hypothetical protein Bccel_4792 [Pseudobacteroides cellulosolvens ATCC 35603 = DSM 2933]